MPNSDKEETEQTNENPTPDAEEKEVSTEAAVSQLNSAVRGDQRTDPEIDEAIDELEEEFGDLSTILVDVHFNENRAEFFLEVLPTIREVSREYAGKARFYLHEEPNDDLYLLVSPKPHEFNTQWLQIRNPQGGVEAFEKYGDSLLKAVMAYPKFDEVDWKVNGNGVNAPMAMTKSRLTDTFFKYELVDPNEPNTVAFNQDEVDDAETVAERSTSKPSL